jgi:iron complex outermembrane receptor protein
MLTPRRRGAVRLSCCLPLLALGFDVAGRAAAETLALDDLDAAWGDPPLVLTPARLPQRLDEAPNAMTVIDRATIEASGARRLIDVLRLVPGFQVGYKTNSLPTATYHGLSDEFARRSLLLLDGQRIFQYSRGVIEWNNLPVPLENIERIEVVRGPAAAAYGSNALQAVINIQTGSPAEYPGLSTRIAAGGGGIADGFARYGGRIGAMDYTLSLASQGDSGYPNVPDDRRNTSLSLAGELPFGAGGELKLQAGFARGEYTVSNPAIAAPPTRDFPVTDNFQSLRWRRSTPRDEWTLTLSHNAFHYGDSGFRTDRLLPGTPLRVDYQIDEERYEADVQYVRHFSEAWRAVARFGYYQERVRSPFYFDTDATLRHEVSWLAGHGEYRIDPAWILNAGAMLEHSSLTDDWLFLPRVSLHHHLDDRHTLRAAYSTGSRQPTLYENQGRAIVRGANVPLTIYRVHASGGLDPEINRAVELGYHWRPSRFAHLDVRLFQERYSNYIGTFYRFAPELPTLLPGHQVLDFANDDPIVVRGLEAQWDWRNSSGTRLFAGYALTDIDASGTRYDAGYAESAPRHGLGLLVSQEFGAGWQASLNYDYQSGMQWYRDPQIDGYHQLGLRVARRFNVGSTSVLAELIGANLLGSVSDYLPDRAWERVLFFRLAVGY